MKRASRQEVFDLACRGARFRFSGVCGRTPRDSEISRCERGRGIAAQRFGHRKPRKASGGLSFLNSALLLARAVSRHSSSMGSSARRAIQVDTNTMDMHAAPSSEPFASACLLLMDSGPDLSRAAGLLHPLVVHFPIALALVAIGAEWWRSVTRQQGFSPLTRPLLWLAAISAVAASATGWINA